MLHLLKIEEIKHVDIDGTVLWQENDVYNVFHRNGQLYILSVAFATASGVTIPASYYIGLDNRTTPSANDTLLSLSGEPTQNGYLRQAVSSANGFSVDLEDDDYRAMSSIVTFTASGGSWGPVRSLFLATSSTNTGYLISSATIDNPRTVLDGQTITMRISVGLVNC